MSMQPSSEPSTASRRTLRIMLIVESSGAGTGRHVCDLAEGLLARGHEVHLVYSTGRIDKLFKQRIAAMPKLKTLSFAMRTSPHPSDFFIVRRIRKYAREQGPFDFVHGHSSKGGAIARLVALGTGAKAFYTLHGLIMMDPGLSRVKRLFYQIVEIGLSWRTSKIVAVSPEEAEGARLAWLGRSRIVTIPNGIAPMDLTPRDEARAALGVDSNAAVVGFVGRLVSQKAPDMLLNAFALAAKSVPQVRLAIVGGGPLESSLRELSERLGIAEKVLWLGPRDAREVYAAFDVFALASMKEGLPYVVLEAMVTGLPVVATNTAGVGILVKPGVSGFVVRSGDVMGFADGLIALAADKPRREEFGRASLRMSEQFTIDVMVDSTLQAYRSSLSQDVSTGSDPVPQGGMPAVKT